jgi:hypothetical protein
MRPVPLVAAGSPACRRLAWALLAAVVALLVVPCPSAAAGEGLAVEGSDHLRLRLEAGAPRLEEYANAGYSLRRVSPAAQVAADAGAASDADAGTAGEEWSVEVSLAPLASTQPFAAPAPVGEVPVREMPARAIEAPVGQSGGESGAPPSVPTLARQITAGAGDRYAAVSAVLGWMVSHLMEEEARREGGSRTEGAAPASPTSGVAGGTAQTPEAVLARGGGDAGGIARLGVALLTAVGIEARPVGGWVVGAPEIGAPHGPHTWIEVYYPDRGWTFSDPLRFHHYVPATYLRLAPAPGAAAGGTGAARPEGGATGPTAAASAGSRWSEVLERRDRRQTVDLYPAAGPGVSARKNAGEQVAGALRVVVSGAGRGSAVLVGTDTRLSRVLVGGESVFVGLRGGSYRLEVYLEGRPPLIRQIELAPRQRTAVFLRDAQVSQHSEARLPRTQSSDDTFRPAP